MASSTQIKGNRNLQGNALVTHDPKRRNCLRIDLTVAFPLLLDERQSLAMSDFPQEGQFGRYLGVVKGGAFL